MIGYLGLDKELSTNIQVKVTYVGELFGYGKRNQAFGWMLSFWKKWGRTLKQKHSFMWCNKIIHHAYAFFKWQIRITVCTIYDRSCSVFIWSPLQCT